MCNLKLQVAYLILQIPGPPHYIHNPPGIPDGSMPQQHHNKQNISCNFFLFAVSDSMILPKNWFSIIMDSPIQPSQYYMNFWISSLSTVTMFSLQNRLGLLLSRWSVGDRRSLPLWLRLRVGVTVGRQTDAAAFKVIIADSPAVCSNRILKLSDS